MENTIKLFSTIPGIEIHITELDMSVYTEPGVEYLKPPILFDKDYQAKLVYWALVEPKVLSPLTQQGSIVKGTAVVDGREDDAYNISKPIVITSEGKNIASIKTLWGPRSIFIFAEIYDTSKDATDSFTVFF